MPSLSIENSKVSSPDAVQQSGPSPWQCAKEQKQKAIVWTIGGSDSGAGAGIQADLKTMNGLGAYGCSVITAVTAQNTERVLSVCPVEAELIEAQLQALITDLPPLAVKTGMLWSARTLLKVSACLEKMKETRSIFLVCDPVMVASSGDSLQDGDLAKLMISHLIPQADLITPNIFETEVLLASHEQENSRQPLHPKSIEPEPLERPSSTCFEHGDQLPSISFQHKGRLQPLHPNLAEAEPLEQNSLQALQIDRQIENLAERLIELRAKSVLITGGHRDGEYSQDLFFDGKTKCWLTSPRINTRHSHGTGCTLSSAVAACLANGYSLLDAVVLGKAYVNQGLRLCPEVGLGHGPLAHLGFPEHHADIPWLTDTADQGRKRRRFPAIEEAIGFYPIVDSSNWVERLAPLGLRSIQLRIKEATEERLEYEISRSVHIAAKHNCRLFINDYWQLAIKYGAYGVHLGQSDIRSADLAVVAAANIRLGVSSHCYEEVARALALRPSYVAVGPLFPTTTKYMPFKPFGLEGLARWRRTINAPLVAIGGIELDKSKPIIELGVSGIAVVRDLRDAADPESRAREWMRLFNGHSTEFL